jgi:hypothetical protein
MEIQDEIGMLSPLFCYRFSFTVWVTSFLLIHKNLFFSS